MKNNVTTFLVLFTLMIATTASAQVFDGGGAAPGFLGVQMGKHKHVKLGIDYGLMDYVSLGLDFKYMLDKEYNGKSLEAGEKVYVEGHVSLHAANMIDLGNSDVLLSYVSDFGSSHGLAGSYQYYLSDFFGFYGRSTYYLKRPESGHVFDFTDKGKFYVEAGIIFVLESGSDFRL